MEQRYKEDVDKRKDQRKLLNEENMRTTQSKLDLKKVQEQLEEEQRMERDWLEEKIRMMDEEEKTKKKQD